MCVRDTVLHEFCTSLQNLLALLTPGSALSRTWEVLAYLIEISVFSLSTHTRTSARTHAHRPRALMYLSRPLVVFLEIGSQEWAR